MQSTLFPTQIAQTATVAELSAALRARDLRRDPAITPGGAKFESLLATFLPLVAGAARKLLPENPSAAERITLAVFEAFANRWRKLPPRTLIAPWLLRTTCFAARRERRCLHLPRVPKGQKIYSILFKQLHRFPRRMRDPLLLHCMMRLPMEPLATALGVKVPRLEKRITKGLKWLDKKTKARKLGISVPAVLQEIPGHAPELLASVHTRFGQWSREQPLTPLSRAAIGSWRWLALRRVLKGTAATFGAIVLLLVTTAITFQFLAERGYLNNFFLSMQRKQLAKDAPQLLEPAKPWPVTATDQAHVTTSWPATSADLYRPTNIWLAKLSFTTAAWKGIAPSRVEPVRNMMNGPNGNIILRNPKASRSGLAGVIGIDYNWTTGRLDFAGMTFSNVAVRYRGNGTYLNSLYGPKQSFKVDLNKFGVKQNIAKLDELNFLNSIADFSYLRDTMAQQFFRDLGVPGPRTAYSYLFLDAPRAFQNQPLGLYVLMENIDSDFAQDRFGSKKTPIFKPVTSELFKDLGSEWTAYADIYDLKTSATPPQQQRIVDFAKLVTHADDAEFGRRLPEFLDLEAFAAFLAGNVLLASYDGFLANGQNYYMYLNRSNQFGFIPWDQDHSWGEFGYVGSSEKREQASIWHPASYNFHFLNRVLKVEQFRDLYRRALERALDHYFTPGRLYPQIDQVAAAIGPAIAAENQFRYERFERSVSSTWEQGPRDGAPEGPHAPVHQIKRFIENRVKSVRAQLAGESEGFTLNRKF